MYNEIKMNRIIIWHLDQRVKILRLEREDIEEGIEALNVRGSFCRCFCKNWMAVEEEGVSE